MWVHSALLVASVVFAGARQSPQADLVDELFGKTRVDLRFSDNIIEDARLDVPGLITKYRYPIEVHHVTTEDGYILEMHRIPHGRDNNNTPDNNKPVVFLMHGLLSSSADFVIMGPGNAFAYLLAEEGFDVWMGNARGTYYSRHHVSKNPDSLLDTAFWEFSWDEIGNMDLPAMIDYALAQTGKPRLHYVGHSQGTTAFYVMASLRPEYNEKIISMHSFAPVAYMENNRNLLLNIISPFANSIDTVGRWFGLGEFLPNSQIMTWAGQAACMNEVDFHPICGNILFLLGGWNEDQHNATMVRVKFGHTPAGAAVRQLSHYAQGISAKSFRRYDYGWIQNRRLYGSRRPPTYDLGKITAPVFLHYSDTDSFSDVNDVNRLFRELGRPIGMFRVNRNKFSHLDFVWGVDAKELLFDRVISLIRAVEDNTFDVTV